MTNLLKRINDVNRIVELTNRASQLTAQLTTVAGDYDKTLALLTALKAGELSLDNVQMTANGWELVEVKIEAGAEVDPVAEGAEPCAAGDACCALEVSAAAAS